MSATFTPLVSDSFHRADESPVNPTAWHTIGGGLPTTDQIQIVSNVATTTVQVQDDGQATYINDALPADQYCEVQITRLATNGALFLSLRSGADGGPAYVFFIGGPLNNPAVATWGVEQLASDASTVIFDWTPPAGNHVNLSQNDVITFAVAGGQDGSWYVYQNHQPIGTGKLNLSPQILASSGRVGIQVDTITPAISDIGVVNFSGGSFAPGSSSHPEIHLRFPTFVIDNPDDVFGSSTVPPPSAPRKSIPPYLIWKNPA